MSRHRAFGIAVLEFLAALLLLLLLMPTLGSIAIATRLSSPGPIFVHYDGVSLDGSHFSCLMFRTKHVNSSKLTPWGDLIAQCGFDRLPMLWSVPRGDMQLREFGRNARLDERASN
jgi:putative colanic acid biosynthesis UDP-glucose lipid carrier transferase